MRLSRIAALLLLASAAAAKAGLTVFAAASMTDAMKEMASAYEGAGGEKICFNFASAGALARQIAAGAPADLFVSANEKWMDWLEGEDLIVSESRFNLAGNELVMITPQRSPAVFGPDIQGRIAVGDFKSVPAGMYAEEALTRMGWLDQLRPQLVMASSVRTALLYVERGEVAAGIVYASDAKASGKVNVTGTFPTDAHRLIVYPAAAVSNHEATGEFINFLKSEQTRSILKRHGFTLLSRDKHKDTKYTKPRTTACSDALSSSFINQ